MDAFYYAVKKNYTGIFVFSVLIFLTSPFAFLFSQEYPATSITKRSTSYYAPNYSIKSGTVLYSMPLNIYSTLGVTVANNTIVVAAGGASSTDTQDNYFYRFTMSGTLIDSFPQPGTVDGWGFRDLAFDGTYILASDSKEIRFIDTVNFQVHHSITLSTRTLHRGLAFDKEASQVWSLNSNSGPLYALNAATGDIEKSLPAPVDGVYGIALEKNTSAPVMSIWYAEPWNTANRIIRLTKIDTATGQAVFSYDLAGNFSVNTLVGGLEIISNHPAFPGKTVALLVEQLSNTIYFIELGASQPVAPASLESAGGLGGWVNSAAIKGSYAFLAQANEVKVMDISGSNFTPVTKYGLPAETDGYKINGNYLYMYYPSYEEDYKSYIEIMDISNPNSPVSVNRYSIGAVDQIKKIGISRDRLFVLAAKNDTVKLYKLNISSPTSIAVMGAYPVAAIDMVIDGDYAYMIGGVDYPATDNSLLIYNISSGFEFVNKTIIQGACAIYYSGGKAHIACGANKGYSLYDVSNPSSPSFLGSFGVGSQSYNGVFAYGSQTFLKKNGTLLVIVDNSNPSNIQQSGSVYLGSFYFTAVINNLLYAVANGGLQTINISNPAQPVVETKQNAPAITSGIAVKANAMYFAEENGGIYIYDVSNPESPSYKDFISLQGMNKVFCDGDLLFATDNAQKINFYDISNPFSPVFKSSFQARGGILKAVRKGSCIYIITSNSNIMDVINISDINHPVAAGEYRFQYDELGVDLAAGNERNNIYALVKPANYAQANVELIDVSSPSGPRYISRKTGYNRAVNIAVSNDIIFLLDNGRAYPSATLYAINPADTVVVTTLNKKVLSSNSNGNGLCVMGNYIFVSLIEDKKLISVGWDPQSKLLFTGPGIAQPEPADNAGVFAQNQASHFMIARKDSSDVYGHIYTVNGSYYDGNLSGSKSTKITKIKKPVEVVPPPPVKATLTMGCKSEDLFVCTSDFPEVTDSSAAGDVEKIACEFSAAVSIEDDWLLAGIKFSASGSGHETQDIRIVRLLDQNNNVLSSGDYDVDDGTVTLSINKIVTRGTSITLKLAYYFKRELKYINEVKTFSVSTKVAWLTATPLSLTNFEKLPPNTFTGNNIVIGKVLNKRTNKIYAKIQEAIDDNQTADGDVLSICPCNFSEAPNITKSVSLVGMPGNWKPIVVPPDDKTDILVTLDADSIRIENLIFNGQGKTEYLLATKNYLMRGFNFLNNSFLNSKKGVEIVNAARGGFLSNNYFEGITTNTIKLSETSGAVISDNLFYKNAMGILIEYKANSNRVFNNRFEETKDAVTLNRAAENKIYNNRFSDVKPYFDIQITIDYECKDNEVFENKSDGLNSTILCKSHEPNLIYDNLLGAVFLYGAHKNTVMQNRVKQIKLNAAEDNLVEGNEISNSTEDGLYLVNSHSNIIRKNDIFGNNNDGIVFGAGNSESSGNKNLISGNKIYKNGENGIQIYASSFNTFEDNELYDNKGSGIYSFSGFLDNSESNIFLNNLFYNNLAGITICDSRNCIIKNCKIQRNKSDGLRADNCINLKMVNNNISYQTTAGAGISMRRCTDYVVAGNIIGYNCSGIELDESPLGIIKNNKIISNLCSNTGVWMANSNPEIYGNSISDNNGAGIHTVDNSNPFIWGNNITENVIAGIANSSPAITINAQGNWWGRPTGPLPGEVTGNVSSSGWLPAPILFVCSKESDTLAAVKGAADTASISFLNLGSVKDTLSVTFSDEKGWLKTSAIQKQYFDTAAVKTQFAFEIPADVSAGASDKIRINAQFNGAVISDSLLITAYSPLLHSIKLTPDSAAIMKGDTLQFAWTGLDQFNRIVEFQPKFACSTGRIDSLGLFISDTAGGVVTVSVSNQTGSIRDESIVNVTSAKSVLSKLSISPKEVVMLPERRKAFTASGTDQFGFGCFCNAAWLATGGSIDNYGNYKAGSVNGKFIVVARDTVTGLADTAQVTINDVIPVELVLFTAEYGDKKVLLKWKTATETNNLGFEILRSPLCCEEKDFKLTEYFKAGYIAGKINSAGDVSYSFTDLTPLRNGKYKYRLKQIDLDGTCSYSEIVEVEVKVANYLLEQNYPNPFNPVTNIEYSIPVAGKVCLEIYNSLGQRVELLKNEMHDAGNYKILWNGARYASGVYFMRMSSESADRSAGKFSAIKKMMLLK